MRKRFVLLQCVVGFSLLVINPVWAADSFDMKLTYHAQANLLQIDLERLSRDEIEHVMQKLIVSVNDADRLEENMLTQNHLNKITKYLRVAAEVEDTIKVVLLYGPGDQQKIYEKDLVVVESAQDIKEEKQSVLVTDEPLQIKKVYSEVKEKKMRKFGYERSGNQDYGQKGFGYEGDVNKFGYATGDENIRQDEEFGYERDDTRKLGEDQSYGLENFGYKSKDGVYGREEE